MECRYGGAGNGRGTKRGNPVDTNLDSERFSLLSLIVEEGW